MTPISTQIAWPACKDIDDGLGYFAAAPMLSFCAEQCEKIAAGKEQYELAAGFLKIQEVLSTITVEDDYLVDDSIVEVIADMLCYALDHDVNGVNVIKCGRKEIICYSNFYIVL